VDGRTKQFNASGAPAVGGEFPYMVNDFKSQMYSYTWFSILMFPFQSLLLLNGDLCEGTLVGPSHILTAAQCVFG
jgi:secreted trypsin-like serine protease